ncbi:MULTISPECIES: S26 family signal peptidase [Ferroplasma]|jgi:signal peptidase|uniref:Signal sequence processing protein Sec11 n=2 Tax=Ferroplasma TaxID=74968 RepID=S0AU13_FERAC|nr:MULTISPECIES: S26 family signal peptidase [Ferroplasma]AGO61794.1 signal sequence processing protein Sec11 precursor [Ferroplasma acidarmanus Fer1]MCL4349746.1 S26 family signal peptidase [Candidatus Thermoplasmatota archaeon]WMT53639.1 MAG: S26 family signal peptidase [Ferroplasma acidiphilum]
MGNAGNKRKYRVLTIIFIAAVIIALVGITVYSGVFPPASVVESYSMEHSAQWQYGIIDEGTVVLVKKVNNINDIVTYVQGRSSNISTYGEYGNVILYHNSALNVVTIHRAIFYLEWNGTSPEIAGYHNQSYIHFYKDNIVLDGIGYAHRNLIVNVSGYAGDSGFITVGDHNLACLSYNSGYYNRTYNAYYASDQNIWGIKPVSLNQIVGKAYGYVPWFGLVKLNILRLEGEWPRQYYTHVPEYSYAGLFLSIAAILTIILFPYGKVYNKVKRKTRNS